MSTQLQQWLSRMVDLPLPMLEEVGKELDALFSDKELPINQIASTMMSDPALVLHTLRQANQQRGNSPLQGSIKTVQQATMLLGYSKIRSLHTTLPILERELKKKGAVVEQRVLSIYNRFHHAAIQAMDWMRRIGDTEPADVFISTMLWPIAELLLWLHFEDSALEIEQRVSQQGMSPREAQESVLGVDLNSLSLALIEAWRLPEEYAELHDKERQPTTRTQGIRLAIRLARLAEQGWDSEHMAYCLEDVSQLLRFPYAQTITLVHSLAAKAARHHNYGLPAAALSLPDPSSHFPDKAMTVIAERHSDVHLPELIPHVQDLELSFDTVFESMPSLYEDAGEGARTIEETGMQTRRAGEYDDGIRYTLEDRHASRDEAAWHPPADLAAYLKQLAFDIDSSISLPDVINLTLKGLEEGLGMSRGMFALLSADGTSLVARSVRCRHKNDPLQQFQLAFTPPNLFSKFMAKQQALWLNSDNQSKLWPLIPAKLREDLCEEGFFAMSLYVKERPYGLIYADKKGQQQVLDDVVYHDFKRICHHTIKALRSLEK